MAMKVNRFVFEEKPKSGTFQRVETKKGVVEVGVSPYAETQQLDAIDVNAVEDGPRAEIGGDDR
jgi:hypothetical protein